MAARTGRCMGCRMGCCIHAATTLQPCFLGEFHGAALKLRSVLRHFAEQHTGHHLADALIVDVGPGTRREDLKEVHCKAIRLAFDYSNWEATPENETARRHLDLTMLRWLGHNSIGHNYTTMLRRGHGPLALHRP